MRGIQILALSELCDAFGDGRAIGTQNEFFYSFKTPLSLPIKGIVLGEFLGDCQKIGGTNIS